MSNKIFIGKKLIALAMIIFIGYSANAQKVQKPNKAVPAKANPTAAVKKHRKHKPEPAPQNFQICKNNTGYYICNETPGTANSTHSHFVIKETEESRYERNIKSTASQTKHEAMAPEPQSFPENIYTVIDIGRPAQGRHYISLAPFE